MDLNILEEHSYYFITSTSFQNITPVLKQDINTSSSNIKLTLPNGIALELLNKAINERIKQNS